LCVDHLVFSVFFLLCIIFSLEPEWCVLHCFINNSIQEAIVLFFEVLVVSVSFQEDINQDAQEDRTCELDFDDTFADAF
jgi:hypothetical protein